MKLLSKLFGRRRKFVLTDKTPAEIRACVAKTLAQEIMQPELWSVTFDHSRGWGDFYHKKRDVRFSIKQSNIHSFFLVVWHNIAFSQTYFTKQEQVQFEHQAWLMAQLAEEEQNKRAEQSRWQKIVQKFPECA